jgi:hypothetical protein
MNDFHQAQEFVSQFGLPIMFKAVDGGGGRGIRLVQQSQELEDSFNRACGESPSGQVFVERAAVDGFRHVEVQILADAYGNIGHLWERECSIQRRSVGKLGLGTSNGSLTRLTDFKKWSSLHLRPSRIVPWLARSLRALCEWLNRYVATCHDEMEAADTFQDSIFVPRNL